MKALGLDLAMLNAPRRVFHLIGDPRTGLADDVTSGSMGEITVDMVHHQLSNEVYWYRYEFDGNSAAAAESHRDSRLSEHAKNLLYILRAKDPARWTIPALARKFRIRKQRVLAILALREMEAHKMEDGDILPGSLSAYACPVDLSDVLIDGKTGELLETAANNFSRPKASRPTTNDEPHDIGSQAARLYQVTKKVQSDLINHLSTLAYSLDQLVSDISAQLSSIEGDLKQSIPVAVEGTSSSGSDAAIQDQMPPSALMNEVSTHWSAIKGLQGRVASLSQKLLRLDDESSFLSLEQKLVKASDALSKELSEAEPSHEVLSAIVEGWQGEQLLRLVLSIPFDHRKQLLDVLQPLSSALVNNGVDIVTLKNSEVYLPPVSSPSSVDKAAHALGSSNVLIPHAKDVFGFLPVPEQLMSEIVEALSELEQHTSALEEIASSKSEEEKGMTSADLMELLKLRRTYLSCDSMIASLISHQSSDERDNRDSGQVSPRKIGAEERRVMSRVLQEAGPSDPSRVEQYDQVMSLLAGASHPLDPELESLALAALEELEGSEAKAKAVLRALVPQECTPNPPLDPTVQIVHGEATSAPRSPDDSLHETDSWELIAAHIDARAASKVYHRGSGENHLVRLPTYPSFEGYPLRDFDEIQEGEVSRLNREVAKREEEELYSGFSRNLLFNLGLSGAELWDPSKPEPGPNVTSSLDRPIVVYEIDPSTGTTLYPPLKVVEVDGRQRPLNVDEKVYQERRRPSMKGLSYMIQRLKRKPELK